MVGEQIARVSAVGSSLLKPFAESRSVSIISQNNSADHSERSSTNITNMSKTVTFDTTVVKSSDTIGNCKINNTMIDYEVDYLRNEPEQLLELSNRKRR